MEVKSIEIKGYLNHREIDELLSNVEYIISVAPSMLTNELPLHFSIFLNTTEEIPHEYKNAVFDKFCEELGVSESSHLLSELAPIAFAMTAQENPMPRHLLDPNEAMQIPHKKLHLIDFLGDSNQFKEAKDGLSGWSYVKNH